MNQRELTDEIKNTCPSLIVKFNSEVYRWAVRQWHGGTRDEEILAVCAHMEESINQIPLGAFWGWATKALKKKWGNIGEKEKGICRTATDQLPDDLVADFLQ